MAASEGPDTEPWFTLSTLSHQPTPWRVLPSMQPRPGLYNDGVVAGLDFLLAELARRDMTAVLCLNNMWPWSGGFAQYVSWATGEDRIPYMPPAEGGSWDVFQAFASRFFDEPRALEMADAHVRYVVTRTNAISGVAYRDDPTIMAWELANEPRPMKAVAGYRRWINATAALIKSLDANHLVTIGSEGRTPFPKSYVGMDFAVDHAFADIDYTTIHVWAQNWEWYNPDEGAPSLERALRLALAYVREHVAASARLRKPLILEEFGMSRDSNVHERGTPTTLRDHYYGVVLDEVVRQQTALLSAAPAGGGGGDPSSRRSSASTSGRGAARAARAPRQPATEKEVLKAHCWRPATRWSATRRTRPPATLSSTTTSRPSPSSPTPPPPSPPPRSTSTSAAAVAAAAAPRPAAAAGGRAAAAAAFEDEAVHAAPASDAWPHAVAQAEVLDGAALDRALWRAQHPPSCEAVRCWKWRDKRAAAARWPRRSSRWSAPLPRRSPRTARCARAGGAAVRRRPPPPPAAGAAAPAADELLVRRAVGGGGGGGGRRRRGARVEVLLAPVEEHDSAERAPPPRAPARARRPPGVAQRAVAAAARPASFFGGALLRHLLRPSPKAHAHAVRVYEAVEWAPTRHSSAAAAASDCRRLPPSPPPAARRRRRRREWGGSDRAVCSPSAASRVRREPRRRPAPRRRRQRRDGGAPPPPAPPRTSYRGRSAARARRRGSATARRSSRRSSSRAARRSSAIPAESTMLRAMMRAFRPRPSWLLPVEPPKAPPILGLLGGLLGGEEQAAATRPTRRRRRRRRAGCDGAAAAGGAAGSSRRAPRGRGARRHGSRR